MTLHEVAPSPVLAQGRGQRVILAPDKFKGSLSATAVAQALGRGLRRCRPDVDVIEHPIADGGEGTVDVVLGHGFHRVDADVCGPTGSTVSAAYALRARTAVIEIAAAAGLGLIEPPGPDERTACTASTYGVGQLIRHAMDRGARRIVLGVGGSATTDGGAGMLTALGARLWTAAGLAKPTGGRILLDLVRVDFDGLDPRLAATEVLVACDVDNPLVGPSGAATIYAPQKGASAEGVAVLERALANWANLVAAATGVDVRMLAGAGAAGGLGFGAAALLGAKLTSGIEFLLQVTGFSGLVAAGDLVIVGEGSLDEQSLQGKGPIGVAQEAVRAGAVVVAVGGRSSVGRQLRELGISATYALSDLEPDARRSIAHAGQLLETVAETIAADWLAEDPKGDTSQH